GRGRLFADARLVRHRELAAAPDVDPAALGVIGASAEYRPGVALNRLLGVDVIIVHLRELRADRKRVWINGINISRREDQIGIAVEAGLAAHDVIERLVLADDEEDV